MAEVLFILGAGASAHAGVPVMDNFFDEASTIVRKNEITEPDKNHFKKILKVRESLRKLYSNFELRPGLNNIETIYGLIEMGNLIKIFPDIDNENEILALRTSINKFIVRTIELRTRFVLSRNQEILKPETYSDLIQLVSRLANTADINSSIITFNYDVALDFIMQQEFGFRRVNYCLDVKDLNSGYKLLKLHGSINWGVCNNDKCNNINPVALEKVISQRMLNSDEQQFSFYIPITQSLKKIRCSKCNEETLSDLPLIVPPTWNKTEFHNSLSIVWKTAVEEISRAEIIIIIGYSLPESDLFFKYLLSLGGIDFSALTDFIVIDQNPEVLNKFHKMLGPETKKKFNKNNTIKSNSFGYSMEIIESLFKSRYQI